MVNLLLLIMALISSNQSNSMTIFRNASRDIFPLVSKRSFAPIQSEENMMIDKLNGEDFYDYSDYYDGLDGEHSDIDYNEIRDYFED